MNPTYIFPKRKNTATAGTLAKLLQGKCLTSEDIKREEGSSRGAGIIFQLRSVMGWPIKSTDLAVNTIDGRTAIVSRYHLPYEVIQRTPDREWFVNEVTRERAARRNGAGKW